MQKAALCGWACEFFYGHLFCELLEVWCWLRALLIFIRKPHPSASGSSHQLYCSRVIAPPGDWRIQASFPSLDSVSISWIVDSLGDQTNSLNLLLFQLAGRPTMLRRQKTHQASWELSVVRQPGDKVSIKYSFYKTMLCTPSSGRIIFFSWIFACLSPHAKNVPWKIVIDLPVYPQALLII